MSKNDEFQNAVSAYENVKILKQTLKTENEAIDQEIAEAKNKLEWLQRSYLPFQDFKESIIEFLRKSGQNYLEKMIRPAITDLAVNHKWGVGFPPEKFGIPMDFQIIQKAINEDLPQFMACQIFTPVKSTFFDDRAFLALLFNMIEPTLRNILEKMSPEEFGYNRITPNEIGPGLEDRAKMIQMIKVKIQELENKKGVNAKRLAALS